MSEHDAEATEPLDPEEPHTPFWLTLLGGFLFLFGAIFLLVSGGEETESDGNGAHAETDASEQAGQVADETAGEPTVD